MKKILILILFNLFFSNNFCMELKLEISGSESEEDYGLDNYNNNLVQPNLLINKSTNNQEIFETFFTNPKLKERAKKVLSKSRSQKKIGDFYIIPLDILKKIIFDYLINTKSVDEREIYKNFKNLALTCKQFAKLGKIIIPQIVLISDKQINLELVENLHYIHNEISEFHSKFNNQTITTSKAPQTLASIATKQNRACWLTCNPYKITRHDPMHRANTKSVRFIVMSAEDFDNSFLIRSPLDQIEHALILAAKNNCLAAAKTLLKLVQENKEPVDNLAIVRIRKLYNGDAALHIAVDNINIDFVKLLLKYKADVNIKNKHGETPLLLATLCIAKNSKDKNKNYFDSIEIAKILIKNGSKNIESYEGASPRVMLIILLEINPIDPEIKALNDSLQNSCEIM